MRCDIILIICFALIVTLYVDNAGTTPVINRVRMNCDYLKSDGTCIAENNIRKRGRTPRKHFRYFLLEAKLNMETTTPLPQEWTDDILVGLSTVPVDYDVTVEWHKYWRGESTTVQIYSGQVPINSPAWVLLPTTVIVHLHLN